MTMFTRLEIHFRDGRQIRRVVILPNSGIDAIFLNRAEDRLSVTVNGANGPVSIERQATPPAGLTVEGQVHPGPIRSLRGPGEVCYLRNGVLHCWDPEE